MDLIELVRQDGFNLKRVATTHGGEYAGPCPWCGGSDRFRVWPREKDSGSYWCRGCGKHGDAINYLRERRGMSFKEALLTLGIDRPFTFTASLKRQENHPPPFTPRQTTPPASTWQARAAKLVEDAQPRLLNDLAAMNFLYLRGLKNPTIEASKLGWLARDTYEDREAWGLDPVTGEDGSLKKLWLPAGLVIPLVVDDVVVRLRIRRPHGDPRYFIVTGSDMRPMVFNSEAKRVVIVESELDAILIAQEGLDLAAVVAMGNAQARPTAEVDGLLKNAERILAALDADTAGAKEAFGFWTTTYKNVRRWPVPLGKDPSEAFKKGVNLRLWIAAGLADLINTRGKLPYKDKEIGELIKNVMWKSKVEFDEYLGKMDMVKDVFPDSEVIRVQ